MAEEGWGWHSVPERRVERRMLHQLQSWRTSAVVVLPPDWSTDTGHCSGHWYTAAEYFAVWVAGWVGHPGRSNPPLNCLVGWAVVEENQKQWVECYSADSPAARTVVVVVLNAGTGRGCLKERTGVMQ